MLFVGCLFLFLVALFLFLVAEEVYPADGEAFGGRLSR